MHGPAMRVGIISLAVGLALLFISEFADFAAIKIVAVTLLVGGVIGVGTAAGLRSHATETLKRYSRMFSRTTVSVIAVILVAPMLLVLVVSLVGCVVLLFDSSFAVNTLLVITGSVVALLLLTISLTVVVIGIGAIRGKAGLRIAEEQE